MMREISYWGHQGKYIDGRRPPPPKNRIGNTWFTYVETIGARFFSNNPKNHNHVHKNERDLFSVIITIGKMLVSETQSYDEIWLYDLVQRAHIYKHLHGRYIADTFEKHFIKVLFGQVIDLSYHSFSKNKIFFIFIITEMSFTIDTLKLKIKICRWWWYRHQTKISIFKQMSDW